MEKCLIMTMIHPRINLIFSDNDESRLLFSLICNKIKQVDELEEFIKWHLDVNKEVIREMRRTQKINFSNNIDAKRWAENFLNSYEGRIRKMRRSSNQIFERFHKLNEKEFKEIISNNKHYEKKMTDMIQIFFNKKDTLIGKIIFAYRETWFLANQIQHPNFSVGSIREYKKWVKANLPNLIELDRSLENIHKDILKWKR